MFHCVKCGAVLPAAIEATGAVFDWRTGHIVTRDATCIDCFKRAVNSACEAIQNAEPAMLDQTFVEVMADLGDRRAAQRMVDNE